MLVVLVGGFMTPGLDAFILATAALIAATIEAIDWLTHPPKEP